MPYVSELIGAPVRDPDGRVVAKVTALLGPSAADSPAVEAAPLKPAKGSPRIVPWSAVRVLDDNKLALTSELPRTPTFEPSAGDLSLARQVLDHQIIDVNGVRVVRVNDLQLAPTDGHYRLIGVDISTAGLLRRLGASRVLDALGVKLTPRAIAWESVEPVESGSAGVKLKVSHADLAKLHPSDIAQIISQLDQQHVHEVLADLDDAAAAAEDVRELLTFDDNTAGGLMTTDVVTVPPTVTAEEAIRLVRQQAAAMDNVYYVYVV